MCTTVANKNNTNELIHGKVEKKYSEKTEVFKNKVRFWYSVAVLVHATLLSTRLLSIDFSNSEIEELRLYHKARWQLTTVWSGVSVLNIIYSILIGTTHQLGFWTLFPSMKPGIGSF